MKKRVLGLVSLLVVVCMLFCSCSKAPDENVDEQLAEKVTLALQKKNGNHDDFGECAAEGHIILGHEKKSDGYYVYIIGQTSLFGFENDNFVIIKKSYKPQGMIVEFTNKLEFRRISYTQEGAAYEASVNDMFPEEYRERVANISFEDEQNILNQQYAYANAYLEKIGRKAKVGVASMFDDQYQNMNDYVISPSVKKAIETNPLVANYPFWYGTRERVENGVRYVYDTTYNMKDSRIEFTKYRYDDNNVIEESMYFSTETGEQII